MARKQIVEGFLPLKPHWFHVLLSLSEQPQHGYGIMQDVLERTEGKVRLWPPTLYGTIKRLTSQELIEPFETKRTAEDDDTRRRYYRLTALGRQVLDAECARLEELLKAAQSRSNVRTRKSGAWPSEA